MGCVSSKYNFPQESVFEKACLDGDINMVLDLYRLHCFSDAYMEYIYYKLCEEKRLNVLKWFLSLSLNIQYTYGMVISAKYGILSNIIIIHESIIKRNITIPENIYTDTFYYAYNNQHYNITTWLFDNLLINEYSDSDSCSTQSA